MGLLKSNTIEYVRYLRYDVVRRKVLCKNRDDFEHSIPSTVDYPRGSMPDFMIDDISGIAFISFEVLYRLGWCNYWLFTADVCVWDGEYDLS